MNARAVITPIFFSGAESQCPFRKVKEAEVDLIKVTIDDKFSDAIYSNQSHIFVPIQGAAPIPEACRGELTGLLKTPFQKLVVAPVSSVTGNIPPVTGADVDLNFEERVTDQYLIYQLKTEIKRSFFAMGGDLCRLTRNAWSTAQISPFHPHQLLRNRGSILQELNCKPVTATVTIGDSYNGKCHDRHIPVRVGGVHLFMNVDTKEVLSPSSLYEMNCADAPSPILITRENVIVTADPIVRVLNLTFSHLNSPILHLLANNMDEVSHLDLFDEELFYSSEEIKSYEALVHFQRTKSAVQSRISHAYCGNADCGDFDPSESVGFDPTRLMPSIPNPFEALETAYAYLQQAGSIFAIILLIYYIMRSCSVCYNICTLRYSGYTWGDAHRMTRSPSLYHGRDQHLAREEDVVGPRAVGRPGVEPEAVPLRPLHPLPTTPPPTYEPESDAFREMQQQAALLRSLQARK